MALISPLIDLLILTGTGCLVIGFLLKAVTIVSRINFTILGFSSMDFATMTAVCWGFALVLVARTWIRLHEPQLLEARRKVLEEEARLRDQQAEFYSEDRQGQLEADAELAAAQSAGEATERG